ncbi:hypothetical protein ACLOJK_027925 [Asimina triloba]
MIGLARSSCQAHLVAAGGRRRRVSRATSSPTCPRSARPAAPNSSQNCSSFFGLSQICPFYRRDLSIRTSADRLRPAGIDVIFECFFSWSYSLRRCGSSLQNSEQSSHQLRPTDVDYVILRPSPTTV